MLKKEKATQRNITPSFIIMKSTSKPKVGKNPNKLTINKQTSHNPNASNTDRSSSKASKNSFETYERRVLHLSKLKGNLVKNKNEEATEQVNMIHGNKTFDTKQTRRTSSNDKSNNGRENHLLVNKKSTIQNKNLDKKRSLGSGKILVRPISKSNSKRNEDSLQKEQQQAKIMNVDLIAKMMKQSPTPNYINKLKNKNKEINEKKKLTKSKLLNLDLNIKNEEAIKEYEIFGELGKGAYGVVRMGINKQTGEKVAIKLYQKKHLNELNRLKNLEREITILSRLNNQVIARLIEVIETSNQIYLILEYGGANSLYNYLLSKPQHRLKQCQAKIFIKTIAQTIEYLHDLHIVHRDIKAQNILINRYKDIKLIDFGFSIHSIPPNTIDTFCGTPTYMAPEIVSKIDHIPVYTDMWSLGILLYVMLQGNYPFRSKTQEELFEKIKRGKFEYIHNDISFDSKQIIQSLLKVNPYKRLTIKEILSSKYQKWFQNAHLEQQE